MNPFDLRGPEFLVFYLVFSAVVIAALYFLRNASESSSAPKIDLADPYLIAYLRGGEKETMRVALVTLIDRGMLVVNGIQIERSDKARPDSVRRPVEKALLETYARPGQAASIFNDPKLQSACAQYEETLKESWLLPNDSVAKTRLLWFMAAFFILTGVGGFKVLVALEHGRTNILYLVALMIIAIVVAYKASFPRLTGLGRNMLKDVQTLYAGLKERATFIRSGGATIEPMMLAAAFGVGALAGDGFGYTKTLFPRARQPAAGSSCGSSCGSSSGSSCGGGCGGGCGGCGS